MKIYKSPSKVHIKNPLKSIQNPSKTPSFHWFHAQFQLPRASASFDGSALAPFSKGLAMQLAILSRWEPVLRRTWWLLAGDYW